MLKSRFYLLLISCLAFAACREDYQKPSIASEVSSPVDVLATASGQYFLALNADYSYRYDSGSILILDLDGQKIHSEPVLRLAKSMTLAGSDLIITYDHQDVDPKISLAGKVQIFSVTETPRPSLTLKKTFDVPDCIPINAAIREGYPYFAVSCLGGKLFAGELKADRSQSTLSLVRQYGSYYTRRAMHIDPKRGLLFAFTTMIDTLDRAPSDVKMNDEHSWDVETGDMRENVSDDAPDEYLRTARARWKLREEGSPFHYIVYDFKKEATQRGTDGLFLSKTWKSHPSDYKQELRWMYFNLTNFDGTPDDPLGYGTDSPQKYYRTNFWQAAPDPWDEDSFYLSQRGVAYLKRSLHANSIIKVRITDDPRPKDGGSIPKTKDIFDFKRVFGFKGPQSTTESYLGAFQLGEIEGQRTLLVNSFYDMIYFSKQRYALTALSLGEEAGWNVKVESTQMQDSYFQFALGNRGRVLASSFYDNSLVLLEAKPGEPFSILKKM